MGFLRLLLIAMLVYLGYRLVRSLRALPERTPKPDSSKQPARARRTPHEVLGVAADATPAEIRAAYQKLVQQYHPDRVADLGPELRELAEQRTKELNAAYDALKKRG